MRLTQEEEELLRRYPPATKEALLEAQDDETEMETGTPLGYIDPMEGKFNVPEGRTYVAPSLAPREAFKNESDYESSRGFEDVSPAYWKRGGGDLASEERAQRAKIADYEAQKYGDIANKSDLIKEAIEEKRRGELIANVGQGLSTMFRANADALGRGRDDSGYWNALRQQAASGLAQAEEDRKTQIANYLMNKRMSDEEQRRAEDLQYRTDKDLQEESRYKEKFDYQKQQDALDRAENNRRLDILAKKGGYQQAPSVDPKTGEKTFAPPANKAIEALDRDYIKDYNDWTTGGSSTFNKNRNLLLGALKQLETIPSSERDSISGKRTAIIGKLTGGMGRSDISRAIESDVRQAAQSSMKAALGSSFTEREGERIMSSSYDPSLPVEENIKKIKRSIDELDSYADNANKKAAHFERYNTLGGYKSSAADTSKKTEITPTTPNAPAIPSTPKVGDVIKGHEFLGGDPSDKNNWRKVGG